MSKTIDTEKLRFIDEHAVPETPIRRLTPWEAIFKKIPRGKALVLSSDSSPPSTVRGALKRLHEEGKFKNLRMTTRKIGDYKYEIYIINPTKIEVE